MQNDAASYEFAAINIQKINSAPFDLSNPETTAPSIQTVGERRFYVVPENQISVIEAPPCYNDALKHPAVSRLHLIDRRIFNTIDQFRFHRAVIQGPTSTRHSQEMIHL